MLSDRQLRDYVEGALLPAQAAELERLLADVPNSLREIVAQQRIDQALHVAYGDAASEERIKQSILDIMSETLHPAVQNKAPAEMGTQGKPPQKSQPAKPRIGKSRPAKRRSLPVLAGIVIAAGIVIFLMLHQLGYIARIDVAASGTEVIRNGKTMPARAGRLLRKDDTLRVAESATVEYPDATLLMLGPASSASLCKPVPQNSGKRVQLQAGGLNAVVRPQPSRQPLMIVSDHAVVSITNATCALTADSARTRVEVTAGALHIERSSDNRAVDLKAGEFTEVVAEGELEARPLLSNPPQSGKGQAGN